MSKNTAQFEKDKREILRQLRALGIPKFRDEDVQGDEMKRKIEWTIRVINYGDDPAESAQRVIGSRNCHLRGLWVEQLRYMGYVAELDKLENPTRNVLEFYAPKGLDSKVWADQNAARMRSFGIDAAAAPKWNGEGERDALGSRGGPTDRVAHMERLNRPRG